MFSVKEGWKPLCQFLNKPLPSIPFPHKNKKGAIVEEILRHPLFVQCHREAFAVGSILILLSVFGGYKLATGSGPRSWITFWINAGNYWFGGPAANALRQLYG